MKAFGRQELSSLDIQFLKTRKASGRQGLSCSLDSQFLKGRKAFGRQDLSSLDSRFLMGMKPFGSREPLCRILVDRAATWSGQRSVILLKLGTDWTGDAEDDLENVEIIAGHHYLHPPLPYTPQQENSKHL